MANDVTVRQLSDDGVIEIRDPEINVEDIMARIRENIRSRAQLSGHPPEQNAASPALRQSSNGEYARLVGAVEPVGEGRIVPPTLRHHLRLANEFHAAPKAAVLPRRTRLGPLGWVWAKVVLRIVNRLREFVVQAFEYQIAFNSFIVRALNDVADATDHLAQNSSAADSRLSDLALRLENVEAELRESQHAREALADALRSMRAAFDSTDSNALKTEVAAVRDLTNSAGAMLQDLSTGLLEVRSELATFHDVGSQTTRLEADLQAVRENAARSAESADAAFAAIAQLSTSVDRVQEESVRASEIASSSAAQLAVARQEAESLRAPVAQVPALLEQMAHIQNVLAELRQPKRLDWAAFQHQEQFRGSMAEVKSRLKEYVPFFHPGQRVLDAGCGRGEFLLCLQEVGVGAYGVDADPDMVRHCERFQLDVRQEDVLEHLRSLPERSLDGVFAAQLIEHFDVTQQIEFYSQAYRTLKSGAYLICETPNPLTLVTAATQFYIDPTHRNPVHPDALAFMLRTAGFSSVDLRFSTPFPAEATLRALPRESGATEPQATPAALDLLNENIATLNRLLFGDQDYAAIARR
jgi:SAM-dependent methyltransferase